MSVSRRLLLASVLPLSLTACGFRLRGSYALPFETMYLDMPANSRFTALIARNLRSGTNVRLVKTAEEAQAVLKIINNTRSRTIVALNTKGEGREFELKQSVAFRVSSPNGPDFLSDTVVHASREVSYNDDEYLSRAAEEQMVYDAIEADIVNQMMRRIERAQAPKTKP